MRTYPETPEARDRRSSEIADAGSNVIDFESYRLRREMRKLLGAEADLMQGGPDLAAFIQPIPAADAQEEEGKPS